MSQDEHSYKGIPVFYVWAAIGVGVSYLIRLLFARSLSPAEYGTFYAVTGLVTFFFILNDAGLNASSLYYLTKWRDHSQRFRQLFSMVLAWKVVIGAILGLLLYFLAELLAIHVLHNESTKLLLQIAGFVFIFESLTGFMSSYFASQGRTVLYASAGHVRMLLFFVLSALAAVFMPHENLLLLFVIAWVIAYVLAVVIYALWVPWRKLVAAPLVRSERSEVWSYAWLTVLASAGGLLFMRIDVLFITFFRPAVEVGLYEIALPIAMMLLIIVDPIMAFLSPYVIREYHNGNKAVLSRTLTLAYTLGVFLLLPLAFFQMMYAKEIILLMFGAQYLAAAPALVALAFVIFLRAFQGINFVFLYSTGLVREQNALMWQAAGLNAVLNLLFVPKYGFVAAAYCTAVSILYLLIRSFFLVQRNIAFTVELRSWIKSALLSAVLLAGVFFGKSVINVPVYIEAAVLAGAYLVLYAVCGVFVLRIVSWKQVKEVLGTFIKTVLP